MFAAALPDLDGVTYLGGEETYQVYHHLLGHNACFIAIYSAVLAFICRKNQLAIFLLCAALGHLHLIMDYFGSGPLWPIFYLWPIDRSFKFVNPHGWEFFSWQNITAAVILIAWTIVIAFRQGRTPIELLTPRLDRAFLKAIGAKPVHGRDRILR